MLLPYSKHFTLRTKLNALSSAIEQLHEATRSFEIPFEIRYSYKIHDQFFIN